MKAILTALLLSVFTTQASSALVCFEDNKTEICLTQQNSKTKKDYFSVRKAGESRMSLYQVLSSQFTRNCGPEYDNNYCRKYKVKLQRVLTPSLECDLSTPVMVNVTVKSSYEDATGQFQTSSILGAPFDSFIELGFDELEALEKVFHRNMSR